MFFAKTGQLTASGGIPPEAAARQRFIYPLRRRLFRMPRVSPPVCLLLRRPFRMLQVSPPACPLLRRLSRTLRRLPAPVFCSIQTDLKVP